MATLRTFYPEIKPFAEQLLEVSSLHSVYVRQGCNPHGFPVLYVHGGPGAGTSLRDFRYFDPSFYRVVVVDQRGAGQSKPFGEMRENTLAELVDDFEKIRKHLKIDSWLVFGGSWGSTLGLAYAQAHPQVCRGLILRGIWLARKQEVDFFFHTVGNAYPERAEEFYHYIPAAEHNDILGAYYRRLMDPNPDVHWPAAYNFAKYELGSSYHDPRPDLEVALQDRGLVLGLARTEAHYMVNNMFLEHNQLIRNMPRIEHLHGELVHGRYDSVCPYAGAYELKKHWPKAILTTVNGGGHSAADPEITSALITATDRFKAAQG